MKLTLSLLWERLDACKKEVIELEKVNDQIRDALDTIPFAPRHRQQIKTTFVLCTKKISKLKSRVPNSEIFSKNTEVDKNASDSFT